VAASRVNFSEQASGDGDAGPRNSRPERQGLAVPMVMASPMSDCSRLRLSLALESAHHMTSAMITMETPMMPGRRKCSSICLSNSFPRIAPGIVPMIMNQNRRRCWATSWEERFGITHAEATKGQGQPVLEEVEKDGDQGSGVERDVEGLAWIGPVQEPGEEDEVGGAAHGEKFGEPLHNGEDDRLNQGHGTLGFLLRRLRCGCSRQDFAHLVRINAAEIIAFQDGFDTIAVPLPEGNRGFVLE